MSSYASSSASSEMSDSFLSQASSATNHEDVLASGLNVPAPPTNTPTLRNASVHLPLHLPLPSAPFPEVDVTQLLVDENLKEVPVGFFIEKLRSLGPTLLRACAATQLALPPSTSDIPTFISYTIRDFDPSMDELTRAASVPTHVLAVRAPDTQKTLLFPIHGLIWASKSPRLSVVSSSNYPASPPPSPPASPTHVHGQNVDATTPNSSTSVPHGSLPVIDINLPSSNSLPLLQGYLYLSHDAAPHLLRALLPPSADPLLQDDTATPTSLAQALSFEDSTSLLGRISRIHSLWQNTVALEISDKGLWETMSMAWTIVVGALSAKEKRRRDANSALRSVSV